MVGKYKSLLSHWYRLKEGKCKKKVNKAPDEAITYIERDRLVMVKCKRGDQETLENYRDLSIFSKHSNKWFPHLEDDKVPFMEGSKKFKILLAMMEKVSGNAYEEVRVEKDSFWGPRAVFRNVFMADIMSVGIKIERDDLW